MVSAISKGRLGNFSFVNMAAYCYSLKHGLDFHIQDRSLAPHQWPLYFQELKNPNWNPNLETVYVNDNQHAYRELEFKEEWRDKNIVIGTEDINTGYMQSHRYLSGYEAEIRRYFGLSSFMIYKTVGFHQRYGDYRTLEDKHPTIKSKYIYNSMRFFMALGYDKFYIFSDEIDYAKKKTEEAWQGERMPNIEYIREQDALKSFNLFMSCEHNIVSNSSFSVLAAILNPNSSRKVICPHEDNFFGINNKHLDVSTLYPPDWIRIKY